MQKTGKRVNKKVIVYRCGGFIRKDGKAPDHGGRHPYDRLGKKALELHNLRKEPIVEEI